MQPEPHTQRLARAALGLHDAYQQRRRTVLAEGLGTRAGAIEWRTSESAKLCRRIQRCAVRGWEAAAARDRSLLRLSLMEMRDAASRAMSEIDRPIPSVPGPRELLEELLAAERDFGSMEYNARASTVSVMTEPIELEDVHLGPFAIELGIGAIPGHPPEDWYRVIALEPVPATGNPGVTHPHVNRERLCAGEAAAAIDHALRDGRLSEFFTLARAVLWTYNAGSPYVAIEEWVGSPCDDCGAVRGDEQMGSCPLCDGYYCDGCMRTCAACLEARCRGCTHLGDADQERYCADCVGACEGCALNFGPGDLEDGLCAACAGQDDNQRGEDPAQENSDESQENHNDPHAHPHESAR